MNNADKIWIKSMELFNKYWGCHQLPERSFFFKDYQFPICARCTGIIIGEILGLFLFFIIHNINFLILIVLLLPMIIDGAIQYLKIYSSNNIRRVLTGLLFGFSFIYLVLKIVKLIFLR